MVVRVRQYRPSTDLNKVEELERRCETGPSGSVSLFADFLGDPVGRVRHFPLHTMLVAEIGDGGEIVGVIRAGIKEMVCGKKVLRNGSCKEVPICARAGYILGLRVSPSHRRKGIGLELARRTEQWCREQGAAYAYMATEKSNTASSGLFVGKLGFKPIRSPSILVHPVFQHAESLPSHIRFTLLSKQQAASIYKTFMGTTDFFPCDIESIVGDARFCAGTWLATLRHESANVGLAEAAAAAAAADSPDSLRKRLDADLTSWAIISVWRSDEIFKLHVAGVSWKIKTLAAASRAIDRALPWLRIASFPNVFQPFGMHFVFGLHAQGPRGGDLLTALCRKARNIARDNGCQVVMAELGSADPLLPFVPHWRSMSSMDDLWCAKELLRLSSSSSSMSAEQQRDPTSSLLLQENGGMGSRVFVDPRDV